MSSSPVAILCLLSTTVTFGAANQIYACLTDPEYGPSLKPEKSPFMYNVRNEGLADFFDYLKHHVCQLTVYTAYISYMISLARSGAGWCAITAAG